MAVDTFRAGRDLPRSRRRDRVMHCKKACAARGCTETAPILLSIAVAIDRV